MHVEFKSFINFNKSNEKYRYKNYRKLFNPKDLNYIVIHRLIVTESPSLIQEIFLYQASLYQELGLKQTTSTLREKLFRDTRRYIHTYIYIDTNSIINSLHHFSLITTLIPSSIQGLLAIHFYIRRKPQGKRRHYFFIIKKNSLYRKTACAKCFGHTTTQAESSK